MLGPLIVFIGPHLSHSAVRRCEDLLILRRSGRMTPPYVDPALSAGYGIESISIRWRLVPEHEEFNIRVLIGPTARDGTALCHGANLRISGICCCNHLPQACSPPCCVFHVQLLLDRIGWNTIGRMHSTRATAVASVLTRQPARRRASAI